MHSLAQCEKVVSRLSPYLEYRPLLSDHWSDHQSIGGVEIYVQGTLFRKWVYVQGCTHDCHDVTDVAFVFVFVEHVCMPCKYILSVLLYIELQ